MHEKKSSPTDSCGETAEKTSTHLMWRVGMEFFSGIFMGVLFGYSIDHFFHTEPWGIVTMIVLGAAAGFRNIYRLIQSTSSPLPDETDKDTPSKNQGKTHD